jgi:hypothetical protein
VLYPRLHGFSIVVFVLYIFLFPLQAKYTQQLIETYLVFRGGAADSEYTVDDSWVNPNTIDPTPPSIVKSLPSAVDPTKGVA